jgi:ATP-dependent Clp protease ATP-binding subunit ClpA
MFDRFTVQAREAVVRSQDEARRLRHPFIGTEHLLLGIVGAEGPAAEVLAARGLTLELLRQRLAVLTDDGLDPDALATLGIDLAKVREATEARLGPGALDKPRPPLKPGHIPFSKRAKKVLELAVRESQRLQSGEIGTGHLLLGLISEGDGLAYQMLTEGRGDLDALRDDVTQLMGDRAA